MIRYFRRLKQTIKKHLASRKIVVLYKSDSNDIKPLFHTAHKEMKQLSDFVAAITRLAVVLMAVVFFLKMSGISSGFTKYLFGLSTVISLGVFCSLFIKINNVILLFYASEWSLLENRFLKLLSVFLSVITMYSLIYGIWIISRAVANNLVPDVALN